MTSFELDLVFIPRIESIYRVVRTTIRLQKKNSEQFAFYEDSIEPHYWL